MGEVPVKARAGTAVNMAKKVAVKGVDVEGFASHLRNK
jgi:hypothetical protein